MKKVATGTVLMLVVLGSSVNGSVYFHADPGGPYTAPFDQYSTVTLDGSRSFGIWLDDTNPEIGGPASIFSWEWDIGSTGHATGMYVSLDLDEPGLNLQPGEYTIGLRVTGDSYGSGPVSDYATTTLTITPEPATLSLLVLGGLALLRRRKAL